MTKAARNLTVAATLSRLYRAERAIDIDGLSLAIQCDGSGSVSRFDGQRVFQFDRIDELDSWLSSPRVIEYDGEGNAAYDDAVIEAQEARQL